MLGSAVLCLLALLVWSSDFVSLLRNIEPHVSQNVLDMPAFVVLLPLLECPHHSPEAGHQNSFKEKAATSPLLSRHFVAGCCWSQNLKLTLDTHDWTTRCSFNVSSVLKIVEIILSIASLQLEGVSCSAAQVSGLPQGQDARIQRLCPLVQVILVSACPLRTPYCLLLL